MDDTEVDGRNVLCNFLDFFFLKKEGLCLIWQRGNFILPKTTYPVQYIFQSMFMNLFCFLITFQPYNNQLRFF